MLAQTHRPDRSLEGPRKDAIDPLQQQLDLYVAEANRLRYAQNLHVAISSLPAELLSDAFLYIVESGIGSMCFAARTFNFLRVCKRWNEVAVGFPQLWARWIPGAFRAWPLFSSRSKGAPLFLTWRFQLPNSVRDTLINTATPRRFHHLEFDGSSEELEHILGALDSTSISNTSSIQLHSTHNDNPGEHLTRFLSFPFPKLSKLDINGFLPDSSSSIFATSNLTSLKLNIPDGYEPRHTQSQFSQILQQHPNLRELDLGHSAIPLAPKSGAPDPIVLSQLVDLRLYGNWAIVAEFIDLLNMASPLHHVTIHLQHAHGLAVPAFTGAVKKILTAYYGCPGLDYPRTPNRLSVSLDPPENNLAFDAGSESHSRSNLKLQFRAMVNATVEKTIPLFPLNHLHEFTADGLVLVADDWRRVLREMKRLLHLRLDSLDIGPVLDALDLCEGTGQLPKLFSTTHMCTVKSDQPTAPKLQSLTLRNLDILFEVHHKLLDTLDRRSGHRVGLESLVIYSCRVTTGEYEEDLRDRVEKVTWEYVEEMGLDYDGTDSDG